MQEKFDTVIYEKRGQVAYITLNRPEVHNAMNLRMHEELCAIWDDFEHDDTIWVGVISGAGQRAFSVGQDLKELVTITAAGQSASSFGSRGRAGFPRLTERLELSKPLIAKISGYALGGGFELALACDIIIAADNSSFALPEAKLGLIAGAGGVFRLPRQIPFKVAMGHLLTGRPMGAQRAYELGLVNEVVPIEALDDCVNSWLADMLRCAPLSLRSIKEVATKTATMDLGTAFTTQFAAETRRRESEDCAEGPLAFVEKRMPLWKGK
jgi:crotonobetainyl-CoA hydratase/dehydration protein DpgD